MPRFWDGDNETLSQRLQVLLSCSDQMDSELEAITEMGKPSRIGCYSSRLHFHENGDILNEVEPRRSICQRYPHTSDGSTAFLDDE